ERAAREMESARNAAIDGKDARAVEQKLREAADRMTPAGQKASQGLQRLSRSTAQLADGVKGDRPKLERSAQDLAKQMREQERRRRTTKLMAREQQRLTACRSQCENKARNLMQQRNQNQQKSGSLQANTPAAGGAGQPNAGPRDARGRKQVELNGQAGDGPT